MPPSSHFTREEIDLLTSLMDARDPSKSLEETLLEQLPSSRMTQPSLPFLLLQRLCTGLQPLLLHRPPPAQLDQLAVRPGTEEGQYFVNDEEYQRVSDDDGTTQPSSSASSLPDGLCGVVGLLGRSQHRLVLRARRRPREPPVAPDLHDQYAGLF